MTPITHSYFIKKADAILCEHGNIDWCKYVSEKIYYRDTALQSLSNGKLFFLFGESIGEWVSVLKELSIQPSTIVICGTDITFTNFTISSLLNLFPNTQFFITNWIGYHPRCSLLPLGLQKPNLSYPIKKKHLFGITHCRPNSTPRFEFLEAISKQPLVQPYIRNEIPHSEYFEELASLYFSCCPMGNGFDTVRFWEGLYVGSIPIVKNHFFYNCLKREYPNIPMIVIEEWEDLSSCIQSLSIELYETMMKEANLDCLQEEYWAKKLH